jgi:hypothetical protein
MNIIIHPYFQKYLEQHPNRPKDQKMILLLEFYPVHTGEEFIEYVRAEHPYVQLLYIPAGCTSLSLTSSWMKPTQSALLGTSIFQPADVGLQRVSL